MTDPDRRLLLTLSGDIHLKSAQTRKRLLRVIEDNLRDALAAPAPTATVTAAPPGRMTIRAAAPELEPAADAVSRVSGIYRVEVAREFRGVATLDELSSEIVHLRGGDVAGKKFAVRARVRGDAKWTRTDIERRVGAALLDLSAGVNLDNPEVTVAVHVFDSRVFVIERQLAGPGGLPLGSQARMLSLLSGGFDSPVAAWMLMRRGVPIDFVHFTMDCAQSEHALAVAYELWRRWGAGTRPRAWVVEFREVKEQLLSRVEEKYRQVALKQLMFAGAARLAEREGHLGLVTGESVGQVSSQTIENLAAIDSAHDAMVLRPLSGLDKEEIIDRARHIGTHDLSARAKEVCNLAVGPVITAVRPGQLARAVEDLPADLVDRALAARSVVDLSTWMPGVDPTPVTELAG